MCVAADERLVGDSIRVRRSKAMAEKHNVIAPRPGARNRVSNVFDWIIDILAYSSGVLVLIHDVIDRR